MIFILLPAFNEEKNIEAVLKDIDATLSAIKLPAHIVVINDGSSDRTSELAKAFSSYNKIDVIDFKMNCGVGAVFRRGISWVTRQAENDDILITLDCDCTHPAEIFSSLIAKIRSGCDLSIASRYHRTSRIVKLPPLRALLSNSVNYILKIFFPIAGIKDYTTFFRAYRMEILKQAQTLYGDKFIESRGFVSMAEILVKISKFAPKMDEVGVNLRFDRRQGKSKMKIARTILEYWGLITREKCRELTAFFKNKVIDKKKADF
ncbi:MAG: glycosyltransferase [Candidatus Omnitrophica bacterium]|nr:glycosyltransferase [Candidatus Omnitrophota bacterium]MBU1925265.1 glycosyltransferase [Candidatus Omnitrophota bacterium]